MGRWFSRLRRSLPRRRRHWRYVSGRRKSIGVLLFALLVSLAYAYWYQTNEARIQQKVEAYLGRLTGGKVKVERAQFKFFSGIRVQGLRVFVGSNTDMPFFKGDVVLNHRPWGLLAGRLEPTEIICVGPTVTLVQNLQSGKWNAQRMFPVRGRGKLLDKKVRLPLIRLRRAELEIVELLGGQTFRRRPEPLSVGLVPRGRIYEVTFKDEAGSIQGGGTIDTATGRTQIQGQVGLAGLDKTLPKRFLDWKRKHKLTFEQPWAVSVNLGGAGTTSRPGWLSVELKNVSMEFPPEEGGMNLTGVSGKLAFDSAGIRITGLSGRIVEAGRAVFKLAGEYGGYEPTSRFKADLTITNLKLPLPPGSAKPWGPAIARLLAVVKPAGLVNVEATLRRQKEGKLRAEGVVSLHGVSAQMPGWPGRIEGLKGDIPLHEDLLELSGITGRYGEAEVEISGTLRNLAGKPVGELSFLARGFPFTQDVRKALPDHLQKAWDTFSPRGQAQITVRWTRPESQAKASTMLTIVPGGKASIEYAGFPYRLERLKGLVEIRGGVVYLRSLRGGRGSMGCTLRGKIPPAGSDERFEVFLTATGVPLDERLARALPPASRAAYEACGLSGKVDVTNAVFRRRGDEPTDYRIPVALKDAGIRHRLFPYAITRVSGTLTLTPRQVSITHLTGRHGRGKINRISGKIIVRGPSRGLHLEAEATELELDEELRDALPAGARRAWDVVDPKGIADVTLDLRAPLPAKAPQAASGPASRPATRPAKGGDVDYRLVVSPRDLRIRYRHFPYPLRRVKGEVVIVPGQVRLEELTGWAGSAKVTLAGTIKTTPGAERAEVKIDTGAVKIDKQLLSAMPAEMVQALGLKPGGTVSLALKRLVVRPKASPRRRGTATTAPAAATTRRAAEPFRTVKPKPKAAPPATRRKRPFAWEWSGRIVLTDANLDLGLGGKQFTGYIDGEMSCAGPARTLRAKADVVMASLQVGSGRVGKFTAHLAKDPRSPILRIDKISGRLFGGLVAGFAEVDLGSPRKYGVSLSAENIDLARFLAAIGKRPARPPDTKGLLTGNLQLTTTVGRKASRKATGKLRITRAKLYRLPILLGFLHVINLTLPSDSAFNAADVDYYLKGDKLVFRKLYLQGSALSMLGAGKMHMKTKKLSLTFLVGPARKLPASPVREFLQGISSQLMTVRVTGTLAKPKVRTVPLRNLDATLRELYNPEAK